MAKNDGNKSDVVLYVSRLKKYFEISAGLRTVGYVKAVDDVSLALKRGETIGIVGETGCGKTTLGRSILDLIRATEGQVYLDLEEEVMNKVMELERDFNELDAVENPTKDQIKKKEEILGELEPLRKKYSLPGLSKREMIKYRKLMQPVFQDPFSSLDPRKLIKDSIAEPMMLLTDLKKDSIFDKTKNIMEEIGLSEDHMYRFPHEFSGGQRQRIGIARAIAIEPKLLVLDEPTSALDVSVQAQILNMLKDIQKQRELSMLFISHHLSVIRMMSDRVAVMYLGKIVELAETDRLFEDMLHPYTKALLSAIPHPDPNIKRDRIILEGEIPSPADPPKGCHFHPRCPVAMANCGWSPRDMAEPLRDMLNPVRNREAEQFPEVDQIQIDEANNSLEVMFASPIGNMKAALELFNKLVKKEAEDESGARFKAIKSVEATTNGTMLVTMRKPDTPRLREARKGHFVSCLIYDYNYNEKDKKEEITENASTTS